MPPDRHRTPARHQSSAAPAHATGPAPRAGLDRPARRSGSTALPRSSAAPRTPSAAARQQHAQRTGLGQTAQATAIARRAVRRLGRRCGMDVDDARGHKHVRRSSARSDQRPGRLRLWAAGSHKLQSLQYPSHSPNPAPSTVRTFPSPARCLRFPRKPSHAEPPPDGITQRVAPTGMAHFLLQRKIVQYEKVAKPHGTRPFHRGVHNHVFNHFSVGRKLWALVLGLTLALLVLMGAAVAPARSQRRGRAHRPAQRRAHHPRRALAGHGGAGCAPHRGPDGHQRHRTGRAPAEGIEHPGHHRGCKTRSPHW